MSAAPRKPSTVRRRRRFASPFGRAIADQYANAYGLTPEAGDFLAALRLCDEDDLASALLVLTAEMDVADANGGAAEQEAVQERSAELRQRSERRGDALHLWQTIARNVEARCGSDD